MCETNKLNVVSTSVSATVRNNNCLVCLNLIPDRRNHDDDDSHNSQSDWKKAGSEIVQRFSTLVSRHLSFQYIARFDSASTVQCCNNCEKLVKSFCENYTAWKKLELMVNWELERISIVMEKVNSVAEGVRNLNPNVDSTATCSETRGSQITEKILRFRENFLRSVVKKRELEPRFPLLKLSKIKVPTLAPAPKSTQKIMCRFCKKSFYNGFNARRHERIHIGSKPFLCAVCPKRFITKQHKQIHEARMHSEVATAMETEIEADSISIETSIDENDQGHHSHKNGSPGVKVTVNNNEFKTETIDQDNFETSLAENIADDNDDDDHYELNHSERDHLQIKTEPIEPPVDIAALDETEILQKETKEKKKEKRVTEDIILMCRFCSKPFKNGFNLRRHEKIHTNDKTFKCDFCTMKFITKQEKQKHEKSRHKKKNENDNDLDGKTKTTRRYSPTKNETDDHDDGDDHDHLHYQIKTEPLEPPVNIAELDETEIFQKEVKKKKRVPVPVPAAATLLKCRFCNKSFRSSYNLRTHEKIHTGDKSFKCDFCTMKFITKGEKQKHETNKHKKKNQNDNVMKTRARYKSSPTRRLISCVKIDVPGFPGQGKSGKRRIYKYRYKCRFCPKELTNKDGLVRHEMGHTGQKPFQCQFCEKQFKTRMELVYHERRHTNSLPMICHLCGKGCRSYSSLRLHVRTHSGYKTFKCHHCRKRYQMTKEQREAHETECQQKKNENEQNKIVPPKNTHV